MSSDLPSILKKQVIEFLDNLITILPEESDLLKLRVYIHVSTPPETLMKNMEPEPRSN